jgi:putative membrane protein
MGKVLDPAAFVTQVAQDGMTEVALAKVALAQSENDSVRSFARTMVKDHGDADSKLAALAKQHDIAAPSELDADHQAMVEVMRAKSAAAFDAAYAAAMAKDHAEAVTLFERMANSGDGDFARFAETTLPTLREHKERAEQLRDKTRIAAADDAAHRD